MCKLLSFYFRNNSVVVGVGAWLGSSPLCKVYASTVNAVSGFGASDLYVKGISVVNSCDDQMNSIPSSGTF